MAVWSEQSYGLFIRSAGHRQSSAGREVGREGIRLRHLHLNGGHLRPGVEYVSNSMITERAQILGAKEALVPDLHGVTEVFGSLSKKRLSASVKV